MGHHRAVALVLAGLAAAGAAVEARAEEATTVPAATAGAGTPVAPRDPRAARAVEKMAERLAGAERLAMRGEIAWDVVQPDGRTLEFGATREILVRRPDRMRVDLVPRDGGRRRLFYDGAQLVLHDLEHEVYATVARSGSLDDVAAYAGARLGIPVALAEFLSPRLPALLAEETEDARWVGEATLDGEPCDHVALRTAAGGLQLWIGRDDALPRRITITYEHEEGRPQFRARFTDWDLSPRAPDDAFAFEPPKGAERIAFAPTPSSGRQEEQR